MYTIYGNGFVTQGDGGAFAPSGIRSVSFLLLVLTFSALEYILLLVALLPKDVSDVSCGENLFSMFNSWPLLLFLFLVIRLSFQNLY